MRKLLILPIDIKSRELDARLLHAAIAIDAGWEIIIGSKTLINRNLWRFSRGIYLFSTLAAGRYKTAKYLRKMGFSSQGWDEEGLVYGDKNTYIQERVHYKTMQLIDQIFAWGKKHAEDITSEAKKAGKDIYIAGNPRIDLLRPEMHNLYKNEIKSIKEKYGDFILITTNLSWANPHIIPKEQRELHKDNFNKKYGSRDGAKSYLAYQKRMLYEFKNAIPKIAEKLPNILIAFSA